MLCNTQNHHLTISEKYSLASEYLSLKQSGMRHNEILRKKKIRNHSAIYEYLKLHKAINKVCSRLGDDYKDVILSGNFGSGIGFVRKVLNVNLKGI